MKYASFASEHTVEYVLVPRLTSILKLKFNDVIPIFPWMTREGSSLSKIIHGLDTFKILGLYPKRPKLSLQSHKILIKINTEFLDAAKAASTLGVPVIAGCPLARSLWELSADAKCIWIKLTERTESSYYIDYDDESQINYETLKPEMVLEKDDDLLRFIVNGSKRIDFEKLVQAIRIIRESSAVMNFMGFGSYKPIYFLMRGDKA